MALNSHGLGGNKWGEILTLEDVGGESVYAKHTKKTLIARARVAVIYRTSAPLSINSSQALILHTFRMSSVGLSGSLLLP